MPNSFTAVDTNANIRHTSAKFKYIFIFHPRLKWLLTCITNAVTKQNGPALHMPHSCYSLNSSDIKKNWGLQATFKIDPNCKRQSMLLALMFWVSFFALWHFLFMYSLHRHSLFKGDLVLFVIQKNVTWHFMFMIHLLMLLSYLCYITLYNQMGGLNSYFKCWHEMKTTWWRLWRTFWELMWSVDAVTYHKFTSLNY